MNVQQKNIADSLRKRGRSAVSFRIQYICKQKDFGGLPVRDDSNFKSLLGSCYAVITIHSLNAKLLQRLLVQLFRQKDGAYLERCFFTNSNQITHCLYFLEKVSCKKMSDLMGGQVKWMFCITSSYERDLSCFNRQMIFEFNQSSAFLRRRSE